MRTCALSSCDVEVTEDWKRYCSVGCASRDRPRRKRKCVDGVSRCTNSSCECHERLAGGCVVCGKPKSSRAKQYCGSQKCAGMGSITSNPLYERWLNNEASADGKAGRDRAGLAGWARKYLLNEAGWKCTLCGWDTPHPLSGVPPLEVDHIDGNRNNNFRSNVRVLCPNCHALCVTNKGMNRNAYKGFATEA